MQLEECCIICVGTDINCFIAYKEVKFSSTLPSFVVVSLTDHDFDLALKSPSNITKWGSKLFILIKSSKLLIKDWNSLDVWLGDLYKVIALFITYSYFKSQAFT